MATSSELRLLFKGQDDIRKAVNNVKAGISEVNASVEKHALSVTKVAGAIGLYTIAAAALQRVTGLASGAIIGFNSDLEQAQVSFKVMTGSAIAAQKHLEDLRGFAQTTPFEFPELLEASKRLQAYGVATADVIPLMTTLGNITAGVGKEKLPQLILAYGQVSAATRLMGTELRQFQEAGVPMLATLAEQFGKTTGEIQKMVEAGKISSTDVRKALDSLSADGGRFFNLMAEQSRTFGGAMSNIKDGLNFAVSEGFKPFFDALRDTAVGVADFLQSDPFKVWASGAARHIKLVGDAVVALVTGRGFDLLYDDLNRTFGSDTGRSIADVLEALNKLKDEVLPQVGEGFRGLGEVAEDFWFALRDAIQFVKDHKEAQFALELAIRGVIAAMIAMKAVQFGGFLLDLAVSARAAAIAIGLIAPAASAAAVATSAAATSTSALGAVALTAAGALVALGSAIAAGALLGWKLYDSMESVKPGIEGTELAAIAASEGLGAMNRAVEQSTDSLGMASQPIALYNEWLAAMASEAANTRWQIGLLNEELMQGRGSAFAETASSPYGPGINEGWKNPLAHAVTKPPPGGGVTKEATADIVKWTEATAEAVRQGVNAQVAYEAWREEIKALVSSGDLEKAAEQYQLLGKDASEAIADILADMKTLEAERERAAQKLEAERKAERERLEAEAKALAATIFEQWATVREAVNAGMQAGAEGFDAMNANAKRFLDAEKARADEAVKIQQDKVDTYLYLLRKESTDSVQIAQAAADARKQVLQNEAMFKGQLIAAEEQGARNRLNSRIAGMQRGRIGSAQQGALEQEAMRRSMTVNELRAEMEAGGPMAKLTEALVRLATQEAGVYIDGAAAGRVINAPGIKGGLVSAAMGGGYGF